MNLQREIDRLLARRASEWHQIMESADLTRRAEFVAWLKQSPLHIEEYLEAAYTDRVLAHVDPQRRENIDELLEQIVPEVAPLDNSWRGASDPITPRLEQPARWPRWVALAAGLLLCGVALVLYQQPTVTPQFATTVGEQRTVALADHSTVTLNTDSSLQVQLQSTHRDIELLRGEALFKVAHDPNRPFIVRTRRAIVRAVGTQFDVYEKPSGTLVAVLEGQVIVTSIRRKGGEESTAAPAESLGAGQEAFVKADGTVVRMPTSNVAQVVAWRERRIVFRETALEDMVYEFNRYGQGPHLRLEGVAAGGHHYDGIFDVADPESLADLLAREPDLKVERDNNDIVIRTR